MMTGSGVTTDGSMLRFRDKLAQAVANKLLELGLVKVASDTGVNRR